MLTAVKIIPVQQTLKTMFVREGVLDVTLAGSGLYLGGKVCSSGAFHGYRLGNGQIVGGFRAYLIRKLEITR